MPSYTRIVNSHNMQTNVGAPVFLSLCADCGSVVSHKEAHTAWHENLERVVETVNWPSVGGSEKDLAPGTGFCVCGHREFKHESSTRMCAIIDPMCGCTGFKEDDDE